MQYSFYELQIFHVSGVCVFERVCKQLAMCVFNHYSKWHIFASMQTRGLFLIDHKFCHISLMSQLKIAQFKQALGHFSYHIQMSHL